MSKFDLVLIPILILLWQVVAYGAVNHGSSSHHSDMSYKSMAADLFRLMDQLEIPKAILIGDYLVFLFFIMQTLDPSTGNTSFLKNRKIGAFIISPEFQFIQYQSAFYHLTELPICLATMMVYISSKTRHRISYPFHGKALIQT